VKEIIDKLKKAFFIVTVIAFFINIGLFIFASVILSGPASFELSILSIVNMMLLSFALLREPNQKP
jgi:hypothetical protein